MRPFHLEPELKSHRIVLRKHEKALAELMFKTVSANRDYLNEYLPWAAETKTIRDEQEYIKAGLRDWSATEKFEYGMFTNEDQTYLGNVGVHTINWEHGCCEIGYWIDQQYQGKGYVTEAVQLMVERMFAKGINRIEIRCSPQNERSIGIPERLGFKFEGVLRENRLVGDHYHDTNVYAMLASEFKN